MRVIDVEGVTKKYKDVIAVDNLSLEINEGEIFGLLGPNGAGKSTLINLICCLLPMDKGSIRILDYDMNKMAKAAKKNLGIVPQDVAIYEDLTAEENVAFFAGLYGLKGKYLKERVADALAFVDLTDKAKEFPKSFSGGMKRRLNIACAIAHEPKVIIMDEPTVGIDPQSRNHILKSVKELNQRGTTIVYTSHYMEEVEEICSRVAIIDHGKIIAHGTVPELEAIITDVKSIWVTVDSIAKIDEAQLKAIKGVKNIEIEENIVKIYSSKEVNNLDTIILYFTSNKIPISNLESRTPNLETVFLTLTGRKLRD